jgi:oxygen-dependent protoporphyrinogen oxidase
LEQSSDCKITLLEPAPLGGKVSTLDENGCLMELGPDCFFALKPGAMELIRSLGLEDEIIEPKASGFSILVDGELHEVPYKLINFTGLDWDVLDQAPFLSPNGKSVAKMEPTQPKGGDEDESIASFFRRRFGEDFSRKVVEPLMAGTHGGQADSLSIKALYPTYVDLERKQGSLNKAAQRDVEPGPSGDGPVKPAYSKTSATFLSLKQGMGFLSERLVESLKRTTIQEESALEIKANGVQTEDGFIEADFVICSAPAFAAANLLSDSAPDVATELAKLEFGDSKTITFCFKRADFGTPLKGTGFLVPQGEDEVISGCTFASEKWAGRASQDVVVLRVFLRGDETQALSRIRELLNINGEPVLCRSSSWERGLPQYKVGHLDWLANLEDRLNAHPWLLLAGASYKGVGVPDCIRQGRDAAAKVVERL